jgi:cytochrome b561
MDNTAERWGWLAKSFHWIIALIILTVVSVAFVMTATYAPKYDNARLETVHIWMSRIHQSGGLLVFILVFARLGWRLKQPVPDLPAGLAAYQRWLAKLNHFVLYALMFMLPLSGWASMSAFGEAPTYFLWMEGLPSIVPKVPLNDPFGFSFYSSIHHICIDVGMYLLGLPSWPRCGISLS